MTVAARAGYLVHRDSFLDRYGDYYVAGLQLGADAGLGFTLRGESKQRDKSVTLSVTVNIFDSCIRQLLTLTLTAFRYTPSSGMIPQRHRRSTMKAIQTRISTSAGTTL